MKENYKDAIDDMTSLGNKIEQTQISCWPNVKPLMDDELMTEFDKSHMEVPQDLMDDNNMF